MSEYYSKIDKNDIKLIAKIYKYLPDIQNGDPLKDFIDDKELIQALEILIKIVKDD